MRRVSSQRDELAPERPADERLVEVADGLAFDGSIGRNDIVTRWETREFHGYAKDLKAAWYRRPLLLNVNEYLHDWSDEETMPCHLCRK